MNKNRLYIVAGVAGIFLILLAGGVYWLFSTVEISAQEIMSDKAKEILAQQQMKELDAFAKTYDARKPELDSLDQVFVDGKNPIEFIQFLETVAAASGTRLTINLLPANDAAAGANIVAMQIVAKGQFLGVLEFLEKVEYGPYLVSAKTVTVKKVAKDSQDSTSIDGVEAIIRLQAAAK